MFSQKIQRSISYILLAVGIFLGVRYLFPTVLPFLIGGLIALGAEPGVRFLENRWGWRRGAASVLCVSLTIFLFLTVLVVLSATLLRELSTASRFLPGFVETVGEGLAVLEKNLLLVAQKAPESAQPVLMKAVQTTFRDGSAVLSGVAEKMPGMVADAVGWLSQGALAVGTAVLAGYLISGRLPKIYGWLKMSGNRIIPALQALRKTFGKWLLAQGKLMLVTFGVVGLGLLFLRIPNAVLWAGIIALVDGVPILGTGTVMVPWAVISFLQGNIPRGIGLMGVFLTAFLLRNILEPRLVGKSLGIDPLLSLSAFYCGLKLWGFGGMILLPVGVALAKSLLDQGFFRIHK